MTVLRPQVDAKPWGGRGLERFGVELPPEVVIGEALLTGGEATVSAGPHAGRTLSALISAEPDRIGPLGRGAVGGRPLFPLLIKLIDAADDLSVQVHPYDAAAAPLDRLGKTEAWHVLSAAPGARLYLGLQPGVTVEHLADACRRADGSAASLLRQVPARAGTTVLIPAGTVHALGAGVVVYEIQQPSDVTFRLDDWGRVDAHGRSRELHLDQGLGVTVAGLRPELIPPVALRSTVGRRHLLAACRFFALERIALPSGASVAVNAAGSPSVLTVLNGEATLGARGNETVLAAGVPAVVWPSSVDAYLTALTPLVVLQGWVPDLETDVVAPARSAGASIDRIAALGGPLGDVRESLDALSVRRPPQRGTESVSNGGSASLR
ncbi:MAG: class I mannose-6-phosphate isomerase [Chloroflexota bacterium]|nr:class I mannose-6-phosphate isomerase [Chloroflexota bacterium]